MRTINAFSINFMALSIVTSVALSTSMALAQSNIPAPDPLSMEEEALDAELEDTIAEPLGPAQRAEPAPTTETLESAVEQDREPVPLIKRKKDIDGTLRERRYIEHPNASKGLIRIDKDKVYYYKVPESEQKGAANVKIAIYEPTNLANPANGRIDYNNVYDESAFPMVLYEHEWQTWKKFGKFGLTLGGGLFFAQGHGRFENESLTERPQEKFTLLAFPISAGAVYRLQYWDSQPLAPYVGGGLDFIAFAERRDDDQNPTWGAAIGGAPAAHFYAGLAIQLGTGARSFLDLDREYGINKIWITGEYRQYIALSEKYDFGGDAINGGLVAEF